MITTIGLIGRQSRDVHMPSEPYHALWDSLQINKVIFSALGDREVFVSPCLMETRNTLQGSLCVREHPQNMNKARQLDGDYVCLACA